MLDRNKFDPVSEEMASKMHKAIAIIQFKIEGQRIKDHPEYNLEHRLVLDKIDLEKGTIEIEGEIYSLRDKNLPTVDPENPYELTEDEARVMKNLESSIVRSKKLQSHIRFLFSHGSMYKAINGQLLFHSCIPMTEKGDFLKCTIYGETHKSKDLFS